MSKVTVTIVFEGKARQISVPRSATKETLTKLTRVAFRLDSDVSLEFTTDTTKAKAKAKPVANVSATLQELLFVDPRNGKWLPITAEDIERREFVEKWIETLPERPPPSPPPPDHSQMECGEGADTTNPSWKTVEPSCSTATTKTGEVVFETIGSTVSFYPVRTKGTNYVNLCTGLLDYAPDLRDTIRQYTSGPQWFCSKVNMALASDSLEGLTQHKKYICDLKYVIGKYGKGFEGVVQRGVDLTPNEIQAYQNMGSKEFYIPSFTSASTTTPFTRNTTIHFHMHTGVGFAIVIQPDWTAFPTENEVLLSCYNVYRIRTLSPLGVHTEIHMDVLDYHDFHDDYHNTHSLEDTPIVYSPPVTKFTAPLEFLRPRETLHDLSSRLQAAFGLSPSELSGGWCFRSPETTSIFTFRVPEEQFCNLTDHGVLTADPSRRGHLCPIRLHIATRHRVIEISFEERS
ncbi:hypothetical protein Pelo_7650 [Pelomyxa schiedti]|nr:hypothetical protein Pelo_7650 [Pelomyxa schiedti]